MSQIRFRAVPRLCHDHKVLLGGVPGFAFVFFSILAALRLRSDVSIFFFFFLVLSRQLLTPHIGRCLYSGLFQPPRNIIAMTLFLVCKETQDVEIAGF